MDSSVDKPLTSRRIAVTRARHQARTLADRIEALGGRVIEFPTVEIRPLPFDVEERPTFDWIVFTSANAARMFAGGLRSQDRAVEEFRRTKVCVVGPATGIAARAEGFRTDLMPEKFIAEGVAEAFGAHEIRGKRFLLPRANMAREFLPRVLSKMGADVTELIVYATRCSKVSDAEVERFIAAAPDAVTFTSSSTASNFVRILGRPRIEKRLRGVAFASIGPETTKAATAAGIRVSIEAKHHDVEGLVEALAQWAAGPR